MTNPAIQPQPNGDVDISVPSDESEAPVTDGAEHDGPGPEPSVDPANLDHPEELMGE